MGPLDRIIGEHLGYDRPVPARQVRLPGFQAGLPCRYDTTGSGLDRQAKPNLIRCETLHARGGTGRAGCDLPIRSAIPR